MSMAWSPDTYFIESLVKCTDFFFYIQKYICSHDRNFSFRGYLATFCPQWPTKTKGKMPDLCRALLSQLFPAQKDWTLAVNIYVVCAVVLCARYTRSVLIQMRFCPPLTSQTENTSLRGVTWSSRIIKSALTLLRSLFDRAYTDG